VPVSRWREHEMLATLRSGSTKGGGVARRRSLRSSLYHDARVLGTLEAAAKGPGAYAKRYARRRAYAATNGVTRSFLRALGLSK